MGSGQGEGLCLTSPRLSAPPQPQRGFPRHHGPQKVMWAPQKHWREPSAPPEARRTPVSLSLRERGPTRPHSLSREGDSRSLTEVQGRHLLPRGPGSVGRVRFSVESSRHHLPLDFHPQLILFEFLLQGGRRKAWKHLPGGGRWGRGRRLPHGAAGLLDLLGEGGDVNLSGTARLQGSHAAQEGLGHGFLPGTGRIRGAAPRLGSPFEDLPKRVDGRTIDVPLGHPHLPEVGSSVA